MQLFCCDSMLLQKKQEHFVNKIFYSYNGIVLVEYLIEIVMYLQK